MSATLLYFGPSGIGDWCFIYPSLAGLQQRFGCDGIHVVIPYPNDGNRLLLESPEITGLSYLRRETRPSRLPLYGTRWLRMLHWIRRERFAALAVSYLSNQPDFLLLALGSGIARRCGVITRPTPLQERAFTEPVAISPDLDKVRVHSAYAAGTTEKPAPMFRQRSENERRRLRQHYGLPDSFIVLGVGGGRNATWRFWPAEHFRRLIHLLPEHHFVLLGGGADDRRQAAECTADGERVTNLVDRTPMSDALTLIQDAEAVVGNDSGIANLAAALDRPTLALYGPTAPSLTGPALLGAEVLSPDTPCRPCFGADQDAATAIRCGDRRCLREIAPETAASRIRSLLSERAKTKG